MTATGISRSGWRRVGVGCLSGAILSLAFPPANLTFLAFVGLVPLLFLLEDLVSAPDARAGAFAAGWAAGLVYFAALLWWIVLLDAPALTIPWVRYPGTLAIVAYLGLYVGLFATAYVWIRRRTRVPGWIAAPALWTVSDLARSYWELGFAWGHVGYSQVPFLPGLQVAAVAGIHGLTAWVVAVNALVATALRGRRPAAWVAVAVVFGVPAALGWMRVRHYEPGETVRVALVQPNVGNDEKWDPNRRASIFETLSRLTLDGAARGAALVVWPETAAPCYLLKDREWLPYVAELTRSAGVPLFTGCPDYQIVREGGERRVRYSNSAAYFSAAGELSETMSKIELVPFGERMPFSQYIGFFDRLDFGEADFVPGEGPVVFELGEHRFGNLVCFEAIYPWLSRDYARLGVDLLVNITNDSWFGAGSGARQHANMALVRCVETGCGMARAANSGISLAADAVGRTDAETPLFERRLAVVDVPLRRGTTFYARAGDWVSVGSALVSALLVVAAIAGRPRGENRPRRPPVK